MPSPDSQPGPGNVRFSVFEIHFAARELLKHGTRIRLQRQPFEILCQLVSRPGEIVTREELRELLWPGDTFVEYEDSLNTAMRKLRAALSDSSEAPRYIETVARQGYRFIAPLVRPENPHAPIEPISADQRIGRRIANFRVLQLLGGGGMGLVYKAEDLKLGRQVALKFLPVELAGDATARDQLQMEARAVSLLDHPNICPIYQLVEHEGETFLVMQLLEGQTLRSWIDRAVDVRDEQYIQTALALAIQIAEGLQAAHQKGIIHRDIKPANVMVTHRGHAKILDFGVAKFFELREALVECETQPEAGLVTNLNVTRTGKSMGTPSYLSPEQIRGEKLDVRSDLFSFGALLFELFMLKKAFAGTTAEDIRQAILETDVVPTLQNNALISTDLVATISKALQKDRAARYQTAAEIQEDLKRVQSRSLQMAAATVGTRNSTMERQTSRTTLSGNALNTGTRAWRRWGSAIATVLTSAALLAWAYHSRSATHVAQASAPTHRQMTFVGNAFFPAVSADGSMIAYVLRKPGEPQKLMVQGLNATPYEVAHGAEIFEPRWSPEGTRLLYQQYDSATGAPKVFVLEFPRKDERPHFVTDGSPACWSPDGTQVVIGVLPVSQLMMTDVKTGASKRISLPRFAFINTVDSSAKAGLLLAAVKVNDRYELWTIRPDGSDFRKIVSETSPIQSPRWVGESIYYFRPVGNTVDLMKVSLPGNMEPVRVANGLQADDFFNISGDGSRLVYTRLDSNANLWRVSLVTSVPGEYGRLQQLTSGTGYHGQPSYSSDGRWIAFAFGPAPSETNLYRMASNGGQPVALTAIPRASLSSPAWSPDGNSIAFISDQGGKSKVWVKSLRDDRLRVLEQTDASDTNGFLAWYPNQSIVYQKPGVHTYLELSSQGDAKELVPENAGTWLIDKPSFSSAGNKFAAIWNRFGLGLWLFSRAPYSEKKLRSEEIYPFGWSPDGKDLYGLRGPDGGQELVMIDVAHPDRLSVIAKMPGTANGATLSPDGLQAVVGVTEIKSDVWLIDNFDNTNVKP